MRTDEPLTIREIQDEAIYFEHIIEKMKHLFHKHDANHKHLPHAIELEHLKNLITGVEVKLSDKTSKEDIEKIKELKDKIKDKLQDDSGYVAELYDIDEIKNNTENKTKDDFINNLESVYDIDAFHEKNPDFKPKDEEITNPEIIKLKSELKEIHENLQNKLEKKLKN